METEVFLLVTWMDCFILAVLLKIPAAIESEIGNNAGIKAYRSSKKGNTAALIMRIARLQIIRFYYIRFRS